MRFFLSCLLFCLPLFSNDFAVDRAATQQPAIPNCSHADIAPSIMIENMVCPTSGSLSLSDMDGQVAALEPITIDRSYSSDTSHANIIPIGWMGGYNGTLNINEFLSFPGKRKAINNAALYIGPYKQRLFFRACKVMAMPTPDDFVYDPHQYEMGTTNISGREISGRSHPKNTRLKNGNRPGELIIKTGGGMKVKFEKYLNTGGITGKWRVRKHSMANGNNVTFNYEGSSTKVTQVKTATKNGKDMAWAKFNYGHHKVNVSLSNGANVVYDYDNIGNLIAVYRSDASYNHFTYDSNRRLTKKIMPDGRYIQFQYDGEGRVTAILAPSYPDGSCCSTHRINYHSDKKNNTETTVVKDPWNNETVYISRQGRMSEIEKKVGSSLYSTENLHWADNNSPQAGCLLERSFRGADNHLIYIKNYHYDEYGNPLVERLWGNITGNSGPIWNIPGQVMVDLSQEHSQIVKRYTSKHLLASEDFGYKHIEYVYHKDTDLISKRFVRVNGKIVERFFFIYDDNNALVQEIHDDGSTANLQDLNFTHRKSHYKFYNNSLSGLVDAEEERVFNLNTMQEELIIRKDIQYDARGRVKWEAYSDSNRQFIYHLHWEYDSYGSVTKEINALGGEIHRTYDANQNLISETGPVFNHSKHFHYDLMNRLVRKEERHGEESLSMSFQYDPYGRKTKEIDIYGNETDFRYDSFGRLVETVYPAVCNEKGEFVRLSTKTTFDEQGFITSTTDQAGNVTRYKNTIHGKPYAIHHPDGTTEQWEYDINGFLKRYKAPNGLTTRYENDWKGRPLEEKIYSLDNVLLSVKKVEYTTFQPIKVTEPDGSEITTSYDAAGRVSVVEKDGVRTEFSYDSMGRVEENRTAGLTKTRYHYNILGNVTDEVCLDDRGNVLLSKHTDYDMLGRVIRESAGDLSSTFHYNSKDELIELTLAEGRSQVVHTDHHFRNEYGQIVKKTIHADPSGSLTETEFNTLGQVRSVVKKDPHGNVLQKSIKVYSTVGKLVKSIQKVIYKGEVERDFIVYFDYDQLGRQISVVEALGEPIQKTTRYTYNSLGQKESFIKPDGVSIHYSYDEFGRVKNESSSDGSINYAYSYDILGRPTIVRDGVNGLFSEKTYNTRGNLSKEKLGSEHVTQYEYDAIGRMTKVHHAGTEPIQFEYDSSFLRKVSWNGRTVTYDSFDRSGKLLLGDGIQYSYDAAGRTTNWKKGNFSETCKYSSTDNLIHRELLGIKLDYEFDGLNQLQEEKGAHAVSYKSDSLYNRRQKNGSDCALNTLNQLLSYKDSAYEWDLNGNMISKTDNGVTESYVYDAKDRLIEVVGKARYIWDEQNRRIKNNDTFQLYQGMDEVGMSQNGEIKEFRVLGLGKGAEIGASVFVQLGKSIYKPLHDTSGNMIALLDEADELAESYEFTAYGEEVKASTLNNPWGFSSKRRDKETGFVLFGHRFYHPPSGRFVTADPLGYSAGVNLYAYCNNSPLTHNDLYGLEPIPIGPKGESDTPEHASSSKESTKSIAEKVVSAVKSVFETLFRSVRAVLKSSGTGIKGIGYHLPPVMKQLTMFLGHCVTFDKITDHTPTWKEQKSVLRSYDGARDPEGIAVFILGMYTTEIDSDKVAAMYFKLTGYRCYVYTPGSHGIGTDVAACGIDKLGFQPRCFNVLKKELEAIVKGLEPNEKVKLFTHSRGCILANNISKEWRKENNGYQNRVEWQGYAAPVVPDENAFKSVDIIMSSRDIVCCLAGWKRFFPPSHVRVVQGVGIWGLDHAFFSPTYQNIFESSHSGKK